MLVNKLIIPDNLSDIIANIIIPAIKETGKTNSGLYCLNIIAINVAIIPIPIIFTISKIFTFFIH